MPAEFGLFTSPSLISAPSYESEDNFHVDDDDHDMMIPPSVFTTNNYDDDSNQEEEEEEGSGRSKHIEVCVRMRPLIIQNEVSSSSFLGGSTSPTNKKSTTHPISANGNNNNNNNSNSKQQRNGNPKGSSNGGFGFFTRSIRKPALPGKKHKNNNNHKKNDDPHACAWNVVADDTVVQSPDTDIVQGRTCQYTLDRVYGPSSPTKEVYERSVKELVHAAMDGYHTSVLAYGQTGTGKTHTMTGTLAEPGFIPLCIQDCFDWLEHQQNDTMNREYLLRVSYLEVYKEHIRDLLASNPDTAPPVRLYDTAAGQQVIQGLREEVVTSPEQVFRILAQGEARRQVGATCMNAHSSRSHVMVRLWIESRDIFSVSGYYNDNSDHDGGGGGTRVSSLSLVDLAGSESVRLTGSTERRQEGHYINKSLMALGKVVYALSENANIDGDCLDDSAMHKHVPFRDSKLTRLLQPSLSGNAQVVLLCCISPHAGHIEESHNTLKFAVRAKKIPQKAVISLLQDENDKTLLQSYREEIELLKHQLKEAQELQQHQHDKQQNKKDDQQQQQQQQQQQSKEPSDAVPVTPGTVVCSSSTSGSDNSSSADYSSLLEDNDAEVQELVKAIQSMEKLILKSKPDASGDETKSMPALDSFRLNRMANNANMDDGMMINDDDDDEDEMGLLALAYSSGSGAGYNNQNLLYSPVATMAKQQFSVSTPPYVHQTFQFSNHKEMQKELKRIQGLLGVVLKKTQQQQNRRIGTNINNNNNNNKNNNNNHHHLHVPSITEESMMNTTIPTFEQERDLLFDNYDDNEQVRALRKQLHEQQVASAMRRADSSFLQAQLQEKDQLLQEVSAILEAVEERQSQLEDENSRLKKELQRARASQRLYL